MEIYERIKERRKQLGLTADEVGEALGIDRATVYRYEKADIKKLPMYIIEPLARVLQCSPMYLMGWAGELTLTDMEKRLIIDYRKLPKEEKSNIQKMIKYALAYTEKEKH